jgi:hypothetical protein
MKLVICLAMLMGAAALSSDKPTAMSQTVKLIQGLAANVKKDGKAEQASFDTYACWCEKTMERKAKDISDNKDLISEMQTLIKKLKGEIASHGAEIQQLQKDIAQNAEAVKEATGLRSKENKDYAGERMESEQCIGALEAGIKVLSGAGTKKAAFLEGDSLHEAQLLSVVAGLKTVMAHKGLQISDKDMQIMNHFVTKPEDFVKSKGMIAAQTGQNPFGDYAPQSSQITGILQGMYDAMTADLEKDNANEADAQKSFEELMATKAQERKTLEATLQKQETDSAAKTKSLSESEVTEDDATEQMKADEDFFEDTKENCQTKATQWSVRVRMRTEELNGMELAIKILSGGAKTFEASTSTFVQLSAVTKHADAQAKAYTQLKALASQYVSRSVAKIAVEVKMGGHFDKVISMVDEMIEVLRKEEADDIAHRDRCENAQNANKNEAADLASSIKKTEASLKRMGNTKKELLAEIKTLEDEIADTKKSQEDLLDFRNKDSADFKQALKDDHDAANLLRKAIEALSSFYKRNKMDVPQLVQKEAKPEYAQDADKAPEASFSGDYGGRKSESGGILAILAMLVEDTEKEMAEGRADDADAQEKYLKQNAALQATLDSQEDSKANAETELGDLEEKMNDYEKFKNEKAADASAEEDNKKAIGTDCAWVKTHFETRRQKRKTEIQGLVDAKGFLAVDGDALAP